MDPYAVFELREDSWKSATDECGSTKPKWKDQKHTFNIAYLGDDFHITLFDDDPGKDEKICYATQKVSAFTEESLPEFWIPVYWKEKQVGSVEVATTWEPSAQEATKEEHEDDMAKAQAYIAKLMARKKELEEEWEQVQAFLESTKDQVQELRDNLVQCDCHAEYEAECAAAEERYQKELERIDQNYKMAEQKGEDYKEARRAKVEKAEAFRDARLAEFEAADGAADEQKEAKLARIEEMKENEEEEHAKELEKL